VVPDDGTVGDEPGMVKTSVVRSRGPFDRHGTVLRAVGRDDLADSLGQVAADISYFAEGLPDAWIFSHLLADLQPCGRRYRALLDCF
jgi:hypothetical protein